MPDNDASNAPSWQPQVDSHVVWAVERHRRLQAVGLFRGLDASTLAAVERRDIERYFRARDAGDWRVLEAVEDAASNLSRACVEALCADPVGHRGFEVPLLEPGQRALALAWSCLDQAGITLDDVRLEYVRDPQITMELQLGDAPPRPLVSARAALPFRALNTALAWAGLEEAFARLLDPTDERYLVILLDPRQHALLEQERLIEPFPPI